MRKFICKLVLISIAFSLMAESPIMTAMKLEIERSMDKLMMEDMEKPYFISYNITDEDGWIIVAASGGVIKTQPRRNRRLHTNVRVGNYDMDNSNFRSQSYWWSLRPDNMPIGNDITVARYTLWKSTDDSYKSALENLARKKSVIEQTQQEQNYPDFSKEEPNKFIKEYDGDFELNQTVWEEKAIAFSDILYENPEIQRSSVSFYAGNNAKYFVNSEGSAIEFSGDFHEALAIGIAQAEDGTYVLDSEIRYYSSEDDIDWDEFEESCYELSNRLAKMRNADTLDYFLGPILFKEQASAEFFAQSLDSRINAPSKPIYENKDRNMFQSGDNDFENKLGRKVASTHISIFDDPNIEEFNDIKLLGHYKYDDEGVKAWRVGIIEQGILKSFLMSRKPFRYLRKSNGHGRQAWSGISASMANLFIESEEEVTEKKLIDKYLELIEEENLEYGIVVEKLSTSYIFNISSSTGVRSILSRLGDGFRRIDTNSDILPPLVFYKIYPDGRKEYLRKMAFSDLGSRALRDIETTSKEKYVYNSFNGKSLSVIAPKFFILEEAELVRMDMSGDKQPVIAKHKK